LVSDYQVKVKFELKINKHPVI